MLDILRSQAAAAPQRPAIVEENAAGSLTAALTYGELAQHIEAAATALRRSGIAPGERLLFWDTSKSNYLILLLACMQEGVVFIPLHPQSPPAWQMRVADEMHTAAIAPGLAALAQGDVALRPDRIRSESAAKGLPSDTLAILLTSGTTGAAKAAPIHAAMAAAAAQNTIAVFGHGPDSVFLDYIPPFTVGGLLLTGLPQLLSGSTLLCRGFSPFAFADIVSKHKPTHAILLPTMVAVLRHTSS